MPVDRRRDDAFPRDAAMACTPEDLAGALRWRYATKSFEAGRRIPLPI
jgi:hypothetical protein